MVRRVLQRCVFLLIALLYAVLMPAPYVFADSVDGSTPTANTCAPVTAAPTGIQQPTGADASTYTYNSCTGLWENQYYTWSPETQVATPKTPLEYSCDTASWQWITYQWVYIPTVQTFQKIAITVTSLPAGAIVAAGSLNPCAPAAAPLIGVAAGTPENSGSNSATNTTTATIDNAIGSAATTGSATVANNTTAGSATTGDAAAIVNVLNSIASATSLEGGGVTTFVANINGDVQGDLVVDPGQLQPASSSQPLTNTNLTVNSQTTGTITNTINLAATTGSATVANNTTAGSATTGDAAAIADVINTLNSIISSGKSFVGVININGNMTGDILVPQKFLDSLIASNAPSATVSLTPTQASSLGITSANNLTTTNTIQSTATTGSATVANNTTAGSATSGDASTKVTVFNLTGNQVIGTNALLVFVNVSGTWVGVIMNAPVGATAAALGSGITANNIDGAVLNATNNNTIANDITLAATSGNAAVYGNTTAGSATSGDAATAANILNINNAGFNMSGWFGVLFINIFGNWYGNFGVYTPPSPTHAVAGNAGKASPGTPPAGRQVFQFVAAPELKTAPMTTVSDTLAAFGKHLGDTTGEVLGDMKRASPQDANEVSNNRMQLVGGILLAAGLLALATERIMTARNASHSR